MKQETISKEITKGRQSMAYKEILRLGEYKVQVKIKSDAYRSQCYAKISIFNKNDLEWRGLDDIHHSLMTTKDSLAYQNPRKVVTSEDFRDDRDQLVKMAELLLS